MGQSRMFGDDSRDGEVDSPRTTIVGGRPPDQTGDSPAVPTGLQRLLRMASVDPQFRQELLVSRDGVAFAAKVALTASEQAILKSIPSAHLELMIERLPSPAPERREFLLQSARAALGLLGVFALDSLSGCKSSQELPPAPSSAPSFAVPPPQLGSDEPPVQRPEDNIMKSKGGAAPDEPPPLRPDYNHMAPGGVRPDPVEPPPQAPPTTRPSRGIRPDIPPSNPTDPQKASD